VTTLPPDFVVVRTRAQPMSPEERRESIIDAVVPLLKEHGRNVSSRQMAEAAGVAEGTIFRAFGDKETLISAAIARFFDPQPFRDALRAIDPDEPTVDKITQVVQILRDRFHGGIGFMSALGMEGGPPPGAQQAPEQTEWLAILGQIFRPDELIVPADVFGLYVRLLAFATAIPPFNVPRQFDVDELVTLITRGVLPPDAASTATTAPPTSRKKD
jgi:AcrR family transcriptional regulator